VIRRVSASFAARGQWYLTETRAFFACRAATWDTKFGDDLPGYAAAVAEAGIRSGGVVIDVGCGTGRALPPLRQAVGPSGTVVALDVTPEMLSQAGPASLEASATRVLADARSLPFADASADAIFAAGLVNHLPDAEAGFGELARIVRPGGLLVLFHPSGRAALAARHGRRLSPDEPLAAVPLRRLTEATGWRLTAYDDAVNRFFAVAERAGGLSRARPRAQCGWRVASDGLSRRGRGSIAQNVKSGMAAHACTVARYPRTSGPSLSDWFTAKVLPRTVKVASPEGPTG
jgi:SAM-dependent methyltransferase